jgi:hypothetical protein
MANVAKSLGLQPIILCIDTFLGDVNMRSNISVQGNENGYLKWLGLKNGMPTVFEQFMVNVKSQKHDDVILPFPSSSMVGLGTIFRLQKYRNFPIPEFIYLDSSHEKDETFLEIQNCWKILAPGGILLGDDWNWESVRSDVIRFDSTIEENVEIVPNGGAPQWLIRKKLK